jgi:hypothetical protein
MSGGLRTANAPSDDLMFERLTGLEWTGQKRRANVVVDVGSRSLFAVWPREAFSPWTWTTADGMVREAIVVRVGLDVRGPWWVWTWNEGQPRLELEGLNPAPPSPGWRDVVPRLVSLLGVLDQSKGPGRPPGTHKKAEPNPEEAYAKAVHWLQRMGVAVTDQAVATAIGIDRGTLARWKRTGLVSKPVSLL